jgi:hypothetical protein
LAVSLKSPITQTTLGKNGHQENMLAWQDETTKEKVLLGGWIYWRSGRFSIAEVTLARLEHFICAVADLACLPSKSWFLGALYLADFAWRYTVWCSDMSKNHSN